MKRWLLVGATGAIIAFLGVGATYVADQLILWKFGLIGGMLANNNTAGAYFGYLALNLALVSVAATMVFIEPVAAGSGTVGVGIRILWLSRTLLESRLVLSARTQRQHILF